MHMYVCTLKIKLTPLTHPFPTPTFLCLASFLSQITFFVTNFPSLGRQRLQGHAVYSPWFSWRQSHHSILALEAAGFSQGFLPSWTSSHFNVMFDSKLLFCFFCLVICCRSKTTQLILKVVVYLSTFEKKRTMNWSKPLKKPLRIIILQWRNWKLGHLLHFPFFKICIWWSFN